MLGPPIRHVNDNDQAEAGLLSAGLPEVALRLRIVGTTSFDSRLAGAYGRDRSEFLLVALIGFSELSQHI